MDFRQVSRPKLTAGPAYERVKSEHSLANI